MLVVHRARLVANLLNLSTPAGLLVALAGGALPRRTRDGLLLARGYRLPIPPAPAFTVGNVVLVRAPIAPRQDPVAGVPVALLVHEERHASQYAVLGGVLMPVAYVAAAAWSWWRTGDFGAANPFERAAGLADGGYRPLPVRPAREARAQLRGLVLARGGGVRSGAVRGGTAAGLLRADRGGAREGGPRRGS